MSVDYVERIGSHLLKKESEIGVFVVVEGEFIRVLEAGKVLPCFFIGDERGK